MEGKKVLTNWREFPVWWRCNLQSLSYLEVGSLGKNSRKGECLLWKSLLHFVFLLEEKRKSAAGGRSPEPWWENKWKQASRGGKGVEKAGQEEKQGITGLDKRSQEQQTKTSPCTAFYVCWTDTRLLLLQVKDDVQFHLVQPDVSRALAHTFTHGSYFNTTGLVEVRMSTFQNKIKPSWPRMGCDVGVRPSQA